MLFFFILIFFSNIYSFTLKIPELYDKEWRYIPVFITTYSFIFYDISVYCKTTRLYEKMWSKSLNPISHREGGGPQRLGPSIFLLFLKPSWANAETKILLNFYSLPPLRAPKRRAPRGIFF